MNIRRRRGYIRELEATVLHLRAEIQAARRVELYWDHVRIGQAIVEDGRLLDGGVTFTLTPEAMEHRWDADMLRMMDGHVFVQSTRLHISVRPYASAAASS